MDIPAILTAKYPGTLWVLNGDDYSGLEWLDDTSKPTQSKLEELWPLVEYDLAVESVRLARRAEYQAPDGVDDLLAQLALGEPGVTVDDIKKLKAEIKAKYPKPKQRKK